MGFWQNLLGLGGGAKGGLRKVDWLAVEGKVRSLETMATSRDQATMKQLIIQADVLVDSILKEGNVRGATMGERLKTLRPKMDNMSYKHLWQAHIKRNELVHDHGAFVADWERDQYFRYFKEGISALRGLR